jgi:hypothetical protein
MQDMGEIGSGRGRFTGADDARVEPWAQTLDEVR